jgi:NADH-quinone oxidoreductase subunit M
MLDPGTILTTLLLVTGLGGLLIALLPGSRPDLLKGAALGVTLLTFLVSLFLWIGFDATSDQMQFVQNSEWFNVGEFNVRYHVGLDGISLFLVLLTTLLTPLVVLSSWHVKDRLKPYLICFLFLEIGMIGVFVALDLVLFYVFWEVMLIPMYLLIGIWGGKNRIYAAVKFFIYTMAGSVLMLAAIIALYYFNRAESFDLIQITQRLSSGDILLAPGMEKLLFIAFFLAFAIKVPLFPFHTWLPDAHVEAPTGGSVILAGVLLKMGTYGLLRFCLPLFPAASIQFAPWISVLAIVGIIYGALVAMVQPDVKKLVAYSSVSHLGFVVLGIFAFNLQGIEGATLQMINHGISTGALFLLVGMIYDRRHTRMISDFGGLAHRMPNFALLFMVITLSSIGLPGLNGFVGEFLILQGTFLENPSYTVFAATGMILSAILTDLSPREVGVLIPLVLLALWIGLNSSTFLRPMDASVQRVIDRVEQVRSLEVIRVGNRGY